MPQRSLLIFTVCWAACSLFVHADEPRVAAEHLEFFEKKVRPLLARRCYKCHSVEAKALRGGLKLDSRAMTLKGGDSGPAVVAGKPDESLLIQAVRYEANEMPPDEKLADQEIATLVRWVELGAPWPAESAPTAVKKNGYDWATAREHWAWRPVEKPEPPTTTAADRVRSPIDQFVAARLRDAGLRQAAPATPATLVRRAFIDLIGLPPTPSEVTEWVARLGEDAANDEAFAELVDSLLDRPQYGERWGRHWLDVARYSDVGGWSQDNRAPPQAWRYRDWVVKSFNDDLPYDEFVRRQIAGDHVARHQQIRDAAVGTGFFVLGPAYSSDGGDPESVAQAKGETLDDRVDTFSRAFLGLTVSCARCHDHKFDPIPTLDYYSIAGIFNNSREGESPLVDDQVVTAYHDARRPINERNEWIKKTRQQAAQAKRPVSEEEKKQIEAWQQEIKDFEAKAPPKYPYAHTMHDGGSADMPVALRGNLLKPGPVAPRRFLRILTSVDAEQDREHFADGSGRRQLAEAVADPANPLTARVIVNRVWLHHFGRALVRTPNNFGTLGEEPTHPLLLDWLAATFVESGWSIKSLHKLIMSSATYRQRSTHDDEAFSIDGDNRLIWRMNPRRMDIEVWRDSLLTVTGELDSKIGGASIDNIIGSKRRTMYAKVSRNNPLTSDELLRMFDFPIPRASSAKRTSNIVPQQFLFMMNSPFMHDRSQALAARLKSETDSPASRIRLAYRLLYAREPHADELAVGMAFLDEGSTATDSPARDEKRWRQYCQVLLSANEFMFVR